MTLLQAFHLKRCNRTKCKFFSFSVEVIMLWLACKKYKFQSKKQKVLVQLVTSPVGHVLSVCDTGSRSFHCQEKVVAALWSQPHAVPSTLGTKWPRAFARAAGFISWLGMGEPDMSHNTRPTGTLSTVQHFKALTWVKGSHELKVRATEPGELSVKLERLWSLILSLL